MAIQYLGKMWITANEYCKVIKIHRATLTKWIKRGKVRTKKLSGTLLVEIEKNLKSHKQKKERIRI